MIPSLLIIVFAFCVPVDCNGSCMICKSLQFMQGDAARTGAEVITLGAVGSNPEVKSVPAPSVQRTYAIVVVLPTGEVAHFGGATTAVEFSDATAVLTTGA
jgi:hypothetical protein